MILVEDLHLTESKREDQTWKLEGVFMQAGAINRNRRIYSEKLLDREVNSFVNEFVTQNRAVGELNHPQSSQVNPDRICIRIDEIRKDGVDYLGSALVLNTPCGKIVQGLLEGEVRIGVSSRGTGSTRARKDGINEVMDDYKLITIDAVMNPSAPKAIVNAVFENQEMFDELLYNAVLMEEFIAFARARKAAKNIANKKSREQKLFEAFQNVMNSITANK